jgi:hypothetical protein
MRLRLPVAVVKMPISPTTWKQSQAQYLSARSPPARLRIKRDAVEIARGRGEDADLTHHLGAISSAISFCLIASSTTEAQA